MEPKPPSVTLSIEYASERISLAPRRSCACASCRSSTLICSPSSDIEYVIPSPSSSSTTCDACFVDSQVINCVYCGLVSKTTIIATVSTIPAPAEMIIVFCFAVNLFHHARTFSKSPLILSAIVQSPYLISLLSDLLDLYLHKFFICI